MNVPLLDGAAFVAVSDERLDEHLFFFIFFSRKKSRKDRAWSKHFMMTLQCLEDELVHSGSHNPDIYRHNQLFANSMGN